MSAEGTNDIDGGSLKDEGFFRGHVIFGSAVSVEDPFLLELKIGHSGRNWVS